MLVRRKPTTRYDNFFRSARDNESATHLGMQKQTRIGNKMTHEDTKAWLRASRERIGLSQAGLASMSHVTVDMVKKWENPKYGVRVPEDVVAIVQALLEKHQAVVADTLAGVQEIRTSHDGLLPENTQITYYRTQAEYDKYGRDEADGLPDAYQIVNARSREIAVELEHRGIDTEYVYPGTSH
jgi:DNA-binding transcriptional regulator YiaG